MSADSKFGGYGSKRWKVAACALTAFIALGFGSAASVNAQDASPTPASCDAPELPPGTPTPMEEMASPEAMPPMEMASPEAEASPEPELIGTAADEATTAEVTAAVENIIGCVNSGNLNGAAALMTENFIMNEFGTANPYDVAPSLEGFTFSDIEVLGAQTYEDGTVSADVQYMTPFAQYQLNSERWYFDEVDGYWKLDDDDYIAPQIELDAAVVGVNLTETTDEAGTKTYAIEPNAASVVENEAIIFHAINAGEEDHELLIFQLPEGADPMGLLDGSISEEDVLFVGAVAPIAPGEEADLTTIGLPAGVYTMACFFPAEDGAPHAAHGMVVQFEVTAAS